MNDILLELKRLLGPSGLRWAVCGGFALDLYLGHETRPHGDLDIAVPEEDRDLAQRLMLNQGWQVYEFRGWGKLRPLNAGLRSEPGRNLMCLRDGCELVTFWPCEEPGLVLHEWHASGIKELNYLEFLFHQRVNGTLLLDGGAQRALDRAILARDGVSYLAPEVVLFYKAEQPDRATNQEDFEAVFPRLEEEPRAWFRQALTMRYPAGHPWNML